MIAKAAQIAEATASNVHHFPQNPYTKGGKVISAQTERQERVDMEVNRLRAAVDALADAMKTKLYAKARQGFSGWDDGCTDEELLDMARNHLNRIELGDPFQDVDVANFMAFLFARRNQTTPTPKEANDVR